MADKDQRDFDGRIGENRKPSQAEGEREQPGEPKWVKEADDDYWPAKPSQAEGERKPYQ